MNEKHVLGIDNIMVNQPRIQICAKQTWRERDDSQYNYEESAQRTKCWIQTN